jgi:hypothetical protein
MGKKLNQYDITEALSKQQSKAFDTLNLRHQAEYVAKGIRPGDNPELDKRFEKEKEDLHQKMLKHEQWIKELESSERFDQIVDELKADDPYQLNRDNLPEPDPSSDYFKGFQQGYKLQKLVPELNEQLLQSGPSDDLRMQGMQDGAKQYEVDRELDPEMDIQPEPSDDLRTQDMEDGAKEYEADRDPDPDHDPEMNISKEIWDELNKNTGDIEEGPSKEKQPDRGRDI